MEEPIEFGKWYEKEGLVLMFEIDRHNTNAYVQGGVNELTDFVHELAKAYDPKHPNYSHNEIRSVLQRVMEGERVEEYELFCFSDDRIRSARRLDKLRVFEEGLYDGSPEHIQIRHNEQYGGKYPCSDLSWSSRANLVDKVLTAVGGLADDSIEEDVEEVAEDTPIIESEGFLSRVLSYFKLNRESEK
jgi:hypothetical protein